MWRQLLWCAAALCYTLPLTHAQFAACLLPTPPTPPIYNVSELHPVGHNVLIVDFRPLDANVSLLSLGGHLSEYYEQKIALRVGKAGEAELYTTGSLELPRYPSSITSAYLPVRLLCNGVRYDVAVLRVLNVNQYAPVFFNQPYDVLMHETTAVGSTVDTPIMAIDWDPALQYNVTFQLHDAHATSSGMFALEVSPGMVHDVALLGLQDDFMWDTNHLPRIVKLKLLRPLDFDAGARTYNFTLIASVGTGDGQQQNSSQLVVHVMDVDDSVPAFELDQYVGAIPADSKVGTYVQFSTAPIRAHDADRSFPIIYSFNHAYSESPFDIEKETGAIFLRQSLPNNRSSYDLVIRASQTEDTSKWSTTLVRIEVVDTSPVHFTQCEATVQLPEHSPAGSIVHTADVVGAQSDQSFTLSLAPTPTAAMFTLVANGSLLLRDSAAFDREHSPSYRVSLRIETTDNNRLQSTNNGPVTPPPLLQTDGLCQTQEVLVEATDINDNRPAFDWPEYVLVLHDNTPTNTIIGYVRATDADSDDMVEYLPIESQSDLNGVRFDGEVSENGSLAIVYSYQATVRPDMLDEYRLLVKATDRDQKHTVEVPVLVRVNHTDSHRPEFEHPLYESSIVEHAAAGTSLIQVSAVDPDSGEAGAFTYELVSTGRVGPMPFTVNAATGELTVTNPRAVDRELRAFFNLTIGARPSGSTLSPSELSSTRVSVRLIDVNDNAPYFVDEAGDRVRQYTFSVPASANRDTLVGRVRAEDLDSGENGRVQLQLMSNESHFVLTLDGALLVGSSLRHLAGRQQLTIRATDKAVQEIDQKSTDVTVIVDVDPGDPTAPEFGNLQNVVLVDESLKPRSVVKQLVVDGATSIRIVDGDPDSVFGIDNRSVLLLKRLDAEQSQSYNMSIEAQSATGLSSRANLHVMVADVNDNQPLFTQQQYEFVVGHVKLNQLLGTVSATDADVDSLNNQVRYSVDAEEQLGLIVDSDGRLLVSDPVLFRTRALPWSTEVIATDNGVPRLTAMARVRFVPPTQAANASAPHTSVVQVFENADVGELLVQLDARLPRTSAPIVYRLKSSTDPQAFAVGANSGQFTVIKPLDRESQQTHRSIVEACAGASCSETEVVVEVMDVNDNAPVFSQTNYRALLTANMQVGDPVITVSAADPDEGRNGEISYTITKDEQAAFAIDANTGTIVVVVPLASLRPGASSIQVRAADNARLPLFSFATVTFSTAPVNPNAPKFDRVTYNVSIAESAPVGSEVLRLAATDADGDRLSFFWGSDPLTASWADRFRLNDASGEVVLVEPLDAETEADLQLIAVVSDNAGDDERTMSTVVFIHVQDVNEHPPAFMPLPNILYISNTKSPGTPLLQIHVHDMDVSQTDNQIQLSVQPSDGMFAIENRQLIVKQQLNKGVFHLQLIAEDSGALQSAHDLDIVVKTDREKFPVFPQLSYVLRLATNNTQWPRRLHQFQAKVLTGSIRYSLLTPASQIQGLAIDPDSGELSASSQVAAQLSGAGELLFVVRADNTQAVGYYSDVMVEITAADRASSTPQFLFPLYRASIEENRRPGTRLNVDLALRSQAGPSDRMRFWLEQPSDWFSVDDEGNVMVDGDVDAEELTGRSYMIKVFASLNNTTPSSTQLEVVVEDVDEYAPEFDKPEYQLSLPENIEPGRVVYQMAPKDKDVTQQGDNQWIYDVEPAEMHNFIGLTPTGQVVLKQKLDYEQLHTIPIKVTARNSLGQSATALLRLQLEDVNDNPPVFGQLPLLWNLSYTDPTTQTYELQVSDADSGANGQIRFELVDEAQQAEFFSLDEMDSNGRARLSLRAVPNTDHVQLAVRAIDAGSPPQSTVAEVDVRVHNRPVDPTGEFVTFPYPLYNVSLPATAAIPATIDLNLRPAEPTDLQFRVSGADQACFGIEPDAGVLTFRCTPNKQTYSILVTAYKELRSSSVPVNVNIEELVTTTGTSTDRLAERSSTEAAQPAASSPAFQPPSTAQTSSQTMESQQTFTEQWRETSAEEEEECASLLAGMPSVVQVPLLLADTMALPTAVYDALNNHSEHCAQMIDFELQGPAAQYFSQRAGVVWLERLPDLSAASNSLQLDIAARMTGQQQQPPTVTKLALNLFTPTKDKQLQFESHHYNMSLKEEQPAGTVVGRVSAVHARQSQTVMYSLVLTNAFSINKADGLIISNGVFDADTRQPAEYTFVVAATDGQVTDYAAVRVSIEDVNDNAPSFSQTHYKVLVPEGPYGEGLPLGYRIDAYDLDTGENGAITYAISTRINLPFVIEPATGRLRVSGQLDREAQAEFNFTVIASDGGAPLLRSIVPVTVVITDLNDNRPVFSDDVPTRVAVPDDAEIGYPVAVVTASDADENEGGTVIYALNTHKMEFTIDPESGQISTIAEFEGVDEIYELQVIAKDLGRPPRYSAHNITIEIVPSNRTRPQFAQGLYFAEMMPGHKVGQEIITLTAGVGPYEYRLRDNQRGLFSVRRDAGVVELARAPNATEVGQGYTLTLLAINATSKQAHSTHVRIFVFDPNDVAKSDASFLQTRYWVTIAENTAERTMLIDLNSTHELQQTPVTYKFVSPYPQFSIDERTGELYAVQPLDREEKSLHVLRISALPTTNRHKRQAFKDLVKVDWDEVVVIVNVTDANDNPPKFVQSPFGHTYILSDQAAPGQLVARVQVEDADANNDISFALVSSSLDQSNMFTIDAKTGEVKLQADFAKPPASKMEKFTFSVAANDGVNEVTTAFRVFKLAASTQSVIVADVKPQLVKEKDLLELEHLLSKRVGANIKINGISDHITDGGQVLSNMTDIRVYAVDPNTGEPMPAEKLTKYIGSVFPEVQHALPPLRLMAVAQPVDYNTEVASSLSAWELLLIIAACLVIAATCLAICWLIWLWLCKNNKRDDQSVTTTAAAGPGYMLDSRSAGPRPYDTLTLDRKMANALLVPFRAFTKQQPAQLEVATSSGLGAGNGGGGGSARQGQQDRDINYTYSSNDAMFSRVHPYFSHLTNGQHQPGVKPHSRSSC